MSQKYNNNLMAIAIILVLGIIFQFGYNNIVKNFTSANNNQPNSEYDYVKVARVVDGDTIELEDGRIVRYIGINTPETVNPNILVQCYGNEASAKNRELVEGKNVKLMPDISDKDKYGRLLRYVYLEDNTFINLLLIESGFAFSSLYAPDIKYQNQFNAAEKEAKDGKKGLWSPDTCNGELKEL